MRESIDFTELNLFKESMAITEENCNEFLKECLIEFGEEVVEKTKELTPVDTGALKDSWGLTTKWTVSHKVMLYSVRKKRDVKKTLFIRGGGVNVHGSGTSMSVTISNPQKYAERVEYGIGQPGYFMLTKSLAIMRNKMPSIYDAKFNQFRKRMGL